MVCADFFLHQYIFCPGETLAYLLSVLYFSEIFQCILKGIVQMLLYEIPCSGIISGTVGPVDLCMHPVDLFLRLCFCFIQIGKNGKLAAKLFSGMGQAAVAAVIIEQQMKTV